MDAIRLVLNFPLARALPGQRVAVISRGANISTATLRRALYLGEDR